MGCGASVQSKGGGNKTINSEKPKLTPEEKSKGKLIDVINRALKIFSVSTVRDLDEEGEPYTEDCQAILRTLSNSYSYFEPNEIPHSFICQYRRDIAKTMLEHKAISKMCEMAEDEMVRRTFIDKDWEVNDISSQWNTLNNCMMILINYSDSSDDVKIEIGKCTTLFGAMVQLLRDWKDDHISMTRDFKRDDKDDLLDYCMTICHNVAAMEENVQMLRRKGVLEVALTYMESPKKEMRLMALVTVADIANDEEAELLTINVAIFSFLLTILTSSLRDETHQSTGWSAEELTRATRQLARNDTNKKILVDVGFLPQLVTLVKTGNDKEIKEAINCMWVLSFKPENKMRMVQEKGLVSCLEKKFNETEDKSLSKACCGIFWSLREEINSPDSPVKVGKALSDMMKKGNHVSTMESSTSQCKGHIMISYQWDNQELIKRIVKKLRASKLTVWLDIDNMGESTLQAMAEAVENSAVVIIAMSQKYKDSPNTRAEAEYAFQLGKTIIPLKMQKDYRPDGWLGIVLGSKLYYDFCGRDPFETLMIKLRKAILEVRGVTAAAAPDSSALDSVDSPATFDFDDVKKWTEKDKAKWLKKHNMPENTKLSGLPVKDILFLHKLESKAPEFFYHCLETKMGYDSISDLADVSSALSDLKI